MNDKTPILIVDDKPENLLALESLLADEHLEIIKASSGDQALEVLLDRDIALILMDVHMPGMDGYETAELMRNSSRTRHIPIIFVTATSKSETNIFKGYEAGAVDYLFKPIDANVLLSKVRIFCELYSQKLLIQHQNEQLQELATTDALTGLWNRRRFLEALEQECVRAERMGGPLSMALFDLDLFKVTNDVHGHAIGDMVLIEFANVLRGGSRKSDMICRYAGDEFAMLMPATHAEQATMVTDRICQKFADKTIFVERRVIDSTATAGVGCLEMPRIDLINTLIVKTDEALYAAKDAGRNCVRNYDRIALDQCTTAESNKSLRDLQDRLWTLAARSQEVFARSVRGLVQALEARDPYTRSHSENVVNYATDIARHMNIDDSLIEIIKRAAVVHDIGKIGIPDAILCKPASLTEKEYEQMKQHVLIGCQILNQLQAMDKELPIIRHHHERWDGGGYPDGIAGESIPIGARILTAADSLDAMISERVYRPAKTVAQALAIMKEEAGKQFDAQVVEAVVKWIESIGPIQGLTATQLGAAGSFSPAA